MRYIEQGIDSSNNPCWFVLEDANLIEICSSLEEAEKLL